MELKSELGHTKDFLAALILLSFAVSLQIVLLYSGVVIVGLAASLLFLKWIRPFFPKRLEKITLLLWLLALIQAAYYGLGVNPFWGISLCLLLPAEGEKISVSRGFVRGATYLIIFLSIGTLAIFLSETRGLDFLRTPQGGLILLGFYAIAFRRPIAKLGTQ